MYVSTDNFIRRFTSKVWEVFVIFTRNSILATKAVRFTIKFTFCQTKYSVWKVIYSIHVWLVVLPISTLSRSILGVYFTVSTYSCFLWGLGLVSREFDPRKKDKTPDPCFLPIDRFENVEEAKSQVYITLKANYMIWIQPSIVSMQLIHVADIHQHYLFDCFHNFIWRRHIYEQQTFSYLNFISMEKTKTL